jgi:hypothetical protein
VRFRAFSSSSKECERALAAKSGRPRVSHDLIVGNDVNEKDRSLMRSVNQSIAVVDSRFVVVLVRLYWFDPHSRSRFLFEQRDYDLVDSVLLSALKLLIALLPTFRKLGVQKEVLSRHGST